MMRFLLLTASFLLLSSTLIAQKADNSILEDLTAYRQIQKEKTYLQLNKGLFLPGELIGFTAYIVNATDNSLSVYDSNLYVEIIDDNGEVIKNEMFRVEDGLSQGVLEIDSVYTAGQYTLKAYTKYMLQFDEPYFFKENFQVLKFEETGYSIDETPEKIDVQFLPESGHFLNNSINKVGVIATNDTGYGIANAKMIIKNSKDSLISLVDLNKFGIGSFAYLPKDGENYKAVLEYKNRQVPIEFSPEIEKTGVVISATQRDAQLNVSVITNEYSLGKIPEKYVLIVQGSQSLQSFDLEFKLIKNLELQIALNELDPGINVISLLDSDKKPIAERLVFNYEGFQIVQPQNAQNSLIGDSLVVKIPFDKNIAGKVSISVLPKNSLAYNRNHNIVSYLNLKPYLKGNLQEATWYFSNLTREKKLELDNLLITQGWSSYNWDKIFKITDDAIVRHSDQFSFKANIPKSDLNRKNLRYMLHGSGENPPEIFEIPSGVNSFIFDEFIPKNIDNLKISRIKRNDKLVPANLQIDFEPNAFPQGPRSSGSLPYVIKTEKPDISESIYNFELLNADAELLDEVELFGNTAQSPKARERELGNHRFGRVSVITAEDVNKFMTLADFLRSKNLSVIDEPNNFLVTLKTGHNANFAEVQKADAPSDVDPRFERQGDIQQKSMQFYLDDVAIMDPNFFYGYNLMFVDFIEIERRGLGSGMMGSYGSIKIYTKTDSHFPTVDRSRIQEVEIPLTYAEDKKYYTPQYTSKTNDFYQEFGVIDWKPLVEIDEQGIASFKIENPGIDFQLIIEGVTAEGKLIHSVQKFEPVSK